MSANKYAIQIDVYQVGRKFVFICAKCHSMIGAEHRSIFFIRVKSATYMPAVFKTVFDRTINECKKCGFRADGRFLISAN